MPSFKIQNALLLQTRPLGEKSYMLSLFTREKGRFLGVIKAKKIPDIASFVDARWQARLEEQVGTYYLDDFRSFAVNFLDDKERLNVLLSVCELLNKLLPERQAYELLYDHTLTLLNQLEEDSFVEQYLRWELFLLHSIGFGLDFSSFENEETQGVPTYVSPKTGKVVNREVGLPYHDKLLKLPRFLWFAKERALSTNDILNGFALTGYFLTMHAGLGHLPYAREVLIHSIFTKKEKSVK